jgi:hypothetical protein
MQFNYFGRINGYEKGFFYHLFQIKLDDCQLGDFQFSICFVKSRFQRGTICRFGIFDFLVVDS